MVRGPAGDTDGKARYGASPSRAQRGPRRPLPVALRMRDHRARSSRPRSRVRRTAVSTRGPRRCPRKASRIGPEARGLPGASDPLAPPESQPTSALAEAPALSPAGLGLAAGFGRRLTGAGTHPCGRVPMPRGVPPRIPEAPQGAAQVSNAGRDGGWLARLRPPRQTTCADPGAQPQDAPCWAGGGPFRERAAGRRAP